MKAIVQKVNYKRGFVAFTELGEANIYIKSTGEAIKVFIEDYGMSRQKAIEMIMR